MERRESIKAMMLGSFGGLLMKSDTPPKQLKMEIPINSSEVAHDQKLLGQQFFDESEMESLDYHEDGSIEEAEMDLLNLSPKTFHPFKNHLKPD